MATAFHETVCIEVPIWKTEKKAEGSRSNAGLTYCRDDLKFVVIAGARWNEMASNEHESSSSIKPDRKRKLLVSQR